MDISLVSPVFNEDKVIVEFVERAALALSRISQSHEMILINDCSTDSTLSKLNELKASFPQLRVVNLTRNVGQQVATLLGLRKAKGDLVFLLDSDLQVNPEDIITLYQAGQADDEWDVITGARQTRSKGLLRSFSSRVVTRIINFVSGSHLDDPASTFLLTKRDILKKAFKYDILAQNFPMLLSYLRVRFRQVPVAFQPNNHRKSSYNLFKLFEVLLMAVLRYTSGRLTLTLLLLMGILTAGIGSLGVGYLILAGILRQAPLATNMLVFTTAMVVAGFQFLFLGIITYKLETLNQSLEFRQTLSSVDDD